MMTSLEQSYLVTIRVMAFSVDDVINCRTLQRKLQPEMKTESKFRVCDVTGTVTKVGALVTRFQVGDDVAALLPINHNFQFDEDQTCDVSEVFVTAKPASLSWTMTSACLNDGFRALFALHHLAHIRPGDSLLVCNAATPFGVTCLQLARCYDVRTFASVADEEEEEMLRTMMTLGVARISSNPRYLRNFVIEETGGLGADVIIDCGVLPNSDVSKSKPTKHDVITSLAVCGRWVTSQSDLQLDPPDSELLHLKSGSLLYLSPQSLLLSNYRQDRVLHIISDVIKKADEAKLRPHLMKVLPPEELDHSIFPTNHKIVLKI